jgi:hypothetical protein
MIMMFLPMDNQADDDVMIVGFQWTLEDPNQSIKSNQSCTCAQNHFFSVIFLAVIGNKQLHNFVPVELSF